MSYARINTIMNEEAVSARSFVSKVVLVTSFATQSVANFIMNRYPSLTEKLFSHERDAVIMGEIGRTLITANGTVGAHLDFTNSLSNNSLITRPHSHWSWNELVHHNGGGTWEESMVACLDPLEAFNKVFGCSTYDTLVMGPHQLSRKSIILVPDQFSHEVGLRLQSGGYEGTVVGYDAKKLTLREAIAQTMDQFYPDAFKFLNNNGVLTSTMANPGSSTGYNMNRGYFNTLLIKTSPTSPPVVFEQNGVPVFADYIRYSQGKYAGLHHGAVTDIEKMAIAIRLEAMSNNPGIINSSKDILITGGGDLSKTVTFWANALRQKIIRQHYNAETGIEDFAAYIMKKALIAEFRSLIPELAAPSGMPLLNTIVDKSYDDICNYLDNIDTLESTDVAEWRDQFCLFLAALHLSVTATMPTEDDSATVALQALLANNLGDEAESLAAEAVAQSNGVLQESESSRNASMVRAVSF
jgi:hypothetical protein